MLSQKQKCRQYSIEYLDLGFVEAPSNPQLPMCLICKKVFSLFKLLYYRLLLKIFSNEAMKPSRMVAHLKHAHPNCVFTLENFKKMKSEIGKQLNITDVFKDINVSNTDGLKCSFLLHIK